MVFYEVPGGREVLTGEVSAHSWKNQLYVFLRDFASEIKRVKQIVNTEKDKEKHCCM